MKSFTQTKRIVFLPTMFALLMLFSCGTGDNIVKPEATTTPGAYTSVDEVMSIIKAQGSDIASEVQPSGILLAPKSGNIKETKKIGQKKGGNISLSVSGVKDKVRFEVKKKSLKEDIIISMELFWDDGGLGTLYFEFQPSGIQFDPYAQLTIPFELLMMDDVDTFVVTCETGGEVEGISYDVNYKKECLIAYVPHFSWYYLNRR